MVQFNNLIQLMLCFVFVVVLYVHLYLKKKGYIKILNLESTLGFWLLTSL